MVQLVLVADQGDRILHEPLPNLRGPGMSDTPLPNFVDHRGAGAGSRFVGAMDIGERDIVSVLVWESQETKAVQLLYTRGGKARAAHSRPAA